MPIVSLLDLLLVCSSSALLLYVFLGYRFRPQSGSVCLSVDSGVVNVR